MPRNNSPQKTNNKSSSYDLEVELFEGTQSLSNKRTFMDNGKENFCYFEKDVREAVKKLKENLPLSLTPHSKECCERLIDEIFGEDLI